MPQNTRPPLVLTPPDIITPPRAPRTTIGPTLTGDDLDTILIIARNDQIGRLTRYEVEQLVQAYRERYCVV